MALLLLAGFLSAACGARLPADVRSRAANAFLNGTGAGGAGGGSSLAGGGTGTGSGGGGTTIGGGGGGTTPGGGGTVPGGGGGGTTPGGGGSGTTPGGGGGGKTPGGGGGSSSHCPTLGHDPGESGNTIDIGTIADETGPVNGLFDGAVQGMQAFANYVNNTGGVCGFTLHVDTADDGTNCSQNQAQTSSLGAKDFALVGTFSLYDNCGEPYIAQHDIPDLHVALSPQAGQPKSHFDMEPGQGYATGMFKYYAQTLGSKVQHVGTIVEGVPSAEVKAGYFAKAAESQGWKFVYNQTTSPTTSDWTSNFVTMCQRDHIQIFFEATENANYAAKMVNDENSAGCKGVINIIPIAYDQAFIGDVGNTQTADTVRGWNEYSLFFNRDEAAKIPELQLLQGWFARTFPGQPLNLYALFAWSEGRLFQYAVEHAGKTLTRASLIAALNKVKNFSANGIMAPVVPSSKTDGPSCYVLWQITNGQFVRTQDPPSNYRCDGSYLRD